MGRSIVKGCLLAVLVALCGLGSATAQNREKAWELMPYLGQIRFSDTGVANNLPDVNDVTEVDFDNSLSAGFRFGFHYTKSHMIEFWVSTLGTDATATLVDASDSFARKPTQIEADFLTLQVNYVYNMFLHHRDKVVLFVTVGGGFTNVSTFGRSVDPEIQRMLAQLVGESTDISSNFGAGLRLFGSRKVGVRFDLRQVLFRTDATGSEDYLEFNVGLTLILGGP